MNADDGPGEAPVAASAPRRSLQGAVETVLDLTEGRRSTMAALVGASAAVGVLEGTVLLLITRVAAAMAEGTAHLDLPLLGAVSRRTALLLAAGLLAAKLLAQAVVADTTARVASRTLVRTRERLLAGHLRATWEHRSRRPTALVQEHLTTHVDQVAGLLLVATNALVATVNVLALVALALVVSPVTALAIVALAGLAALVMRPFTRTIRRHAETHVAVTSRYAVAVAEGVSLGRDVQVFGLEDPLEKRLATKSRESASAYARSRRLVTLAPGAFHTLAMAAVLIALAVGGEGSIATVGAVVILLVRALGFGQQVQSGVHNMVTMAPALETIRREIDANEDAARLVGGLDVTALGALSLRGVEYRYPDGAVALQDVDLEIAAGEAVGVVGPSGSGKSTLVALLLGLRQPTSGRILASGVALADISPESWHGRVSHVPQDPVIVTASVADNVDLWRGFDRDQVALSVERAHLSADLDTLDDGIDTIIGPHGRDLSGGQRQRLALARALLGGPEILVLDEPTSALDIHSEQAVTAMLAELRGQMTVVTIAHRVSTLRSCDRIVVLDRGRVVGVGSHEELLGTSAFYRAAVEGAAP